MAVGFAPTKIDPMGFRDRASGRKDGMAVHEGTVRWQCNGVILGQTHVPNIW